MNLFQIFLYDCMTTFDHKIIFTQFIKVYRKTVINKPYKNHLSDACIHCSCNAENIYFFIHCNKHTRYILFRLGKCCHLNFMYRYSG